MRAGFDSRAGAGPAIDEAAGHIDAASILREAPGQVGVVSALGRPVEEQIGIGERRGTTVYDIVTAAGVDRVIARTAGDVIGICRAIQCVVGAVTVDRCHCPIPQLSLASRIGGCCSERMWGSKRAAKWRPHEICRIYDSASLNF